MEGVKVCMVNGEYSAEVIGDGLGGGGGGGGREREGGRAG